MASLPDPQDCTYCICSFYHPGVLLLLPLPSVHRRRLHVSHHLYHHSLHQRLGPCLRCFFLVSPATSTWSACHNSGLRHPTHHHHRLCRCRPPISPSLCRHHVGRSTTAGGGCSCNGAWTTRWYLAVWWEWGTSLVGDGKGASEHGGDQEGNLDITDLAVLSRRDSFASWTRRRRGSMWWWTYARKFTSFKLDIENTKLWTEGLLFKVYWEKEVLIVTKQNYQFSFSIFYVFVCFWDEE